MSDEEKRIRLSLEPKSVANYAEYEAAIRLIRSNLSKALELIDILESKVKLTGS